jgi:hypothetical protein
MRRVALFIAAVAAVAAAIAAPSSAWAQADVFGRDTIQGVVQLGLAGSQGLKSGSQGGFGKTEFGPGAAGLASVDGVWRPRFDDALSLVLDAVAQPGGGRGVGLAEAYLLYKPVPTSALRVQMRAGLLYVPVSLEHDDAPGEPWTVVDTLTPSAINSWIGEEVKAVGAEGKLTRKTSRVQVSAALGLFGFNDTSGTLLALRGWSFSELVATASARFQLPPLSLSLSRSQSLQTQPVTSLDRRVGLYFQGEVRSVSGALANLILYDNDAEQGLSSDRQWSWRTRFVNLGTVWPLGGGFALTGQVLQGSTRAPVGWSHPIEFDVQFSSAYLKLTRAAGPETFSARLEAFQTHDSGAPTAGAALNLDSLYTEDGWSGLVAWKHSFAPGRDVLVEALWVDWRRDDLADFGQSPRQTETSLRAAYRHAF